MLIYILSKSFENVSAESSKNCQYPVSHARPLTRGRIAWYSPTLVVPQIWQTESIPMNLRCLKISPFPNFPLAHGTPTRAEIPVPQGLRSIWSGKTTIVESQVYIHQPRLVEAL
jgi:hypothetical protein